MGDYTNPKTEALKALARQAEDYSTANSEAVRLSTGAEERAMAFALWFVLSLVTYVASIRTTDGVALHWAAFGAFFGLMVTEIFKMVAAHKRYRVAVKRREFAAKNLFHASKSVLIYVKGGDL